MKRNYMLVICFVAAGWFLIKKQILEKIRRMSRPVSVVVTTPSKNKNFVSSQNMTKFTIGGRCTEVGQPVVITGDILKKVECRRFTYMADLDLSELEDGPIDLVISHQGADGQPAPSQKFALTKDTTPPKMTVTNWPVKILLNDEKIPEVETSMPTLIGEDFTTVEGTCTPDEGPVEFNFSGKMIRNPCTSGKFAQQLNFADAGTDLQLQISQVDLHGNRSTQAYIHFQKFAHEIEFNRIGLAIKWPNKKVPIRLLYLISEKPIVSTPIEGNPLAYGENIGSGVKAYLFNADQNHTIAYKLSDKNLFIHVYQVQPGLKYRLVEKTDGGSITLEVGPKTAYGLNWYLGVEGQNCHDICAAHGGIAQDMLKYTGGQGMNKNCAKIIRQFANRGAKSSRATARAFDETLGCATNTERQHNFHYVNKAKKFNFDYKSKNLRRYCACLK